MKLRLQTEFPALKRKFDGGKRLVYLDSACTALKSKSAADAARDLLINSGACGGKRSVHRLSQEAEEIFSGCRKTIADFIGAESPGEIIFTRGTTDGANLVAGAFPFSKDKSEVIISGLEHNSIFLPFHRLAGLGVITLKIVPVKNRRVDMEGFGKMLSGRTALVAVTHASNAFGGVLPVKKICETAHEAGAYVLVDDAQFLPSHAENVRELGADMLAFSGHKFGAPFGTGALYVKRGLMDKFLPFKVGGGTVKDIKPSGSDWEVEYLKGPEGFEPGVQDYAGAAGLAQAIKLISSIGMDNVRAKVSALVRHCADRLGNAKGLRILGNSEELAQGAIVPLAPAMKNFSLPDFNIFLNHGLKKQIIAVRTGQLCAHTAFYNAGIKETLRLSFFIYNTGSDIEAFAEALEIYERKLGS